MGSSDRVAPRPLGEELLALGEVELRLFEQEADVDLDDAERILEIVNHQELEAPFERLRVADLTQEPLGREHRRATQRHRARDQLLLRRR